MFKPIEFWELPEIKTYQENKLREMLQYLYSNSKYYQNLFAKYQLKPVDFVSLNDLIKIPCTTKEDFAIHNTDFLCVSPSRIIDYSTTSGTTGLPVTVALTENDLLRLAYNEEQSFLTAGCKSSDVVMLLLTLDRQFMAGMAYYLGIRKLGAAAVRSGVISPQAQWENIKRFKPDVLVAVPSFIVKMLDYATKHGINANHTSVKKVVCIGEPIRNDSFKYNALSSKIVSKWNVELYSTYASTEMQTAFTECCHGSGGHLRPELLIVEILNDAGDPVPEGHAGEVTVTNLGIEGMPLLRYRTGDICTLHLEPCACGRNTPRLSPVTGRKNQMIKYKGTTFFPPAIFDALSMVNGINDYVVEVFNNELETEEVIIHVSVTGNIDAMEKQIEDALRMRLRVVPTIHFTTSQYLQTLRPAESRKPVMAIFR